jgi:acyl-CoA synthetase (NDP forming)
MTNNAHAAISTLLRPRSIAVIGASDDARRMNGAPIRNMLDYGFAGTIYAVNPRRDEVMGIKCYPSISDLPEVPDTAVIAVRADMAIDALEDCAKAGVASATMFAAGLTEGAAGDRGAHLTERLHRILADYPIRLVGPNTAGLQNLLHNYVPRSAVNQFRPEQCKAGGTAIITQSGAMSNILFNKCQANGIGVAYSVGTGSQIDLEVADFLEYAVEDDEVRCIMSLIEGVGDAQRLADVLAKAAQKRKPIVLLKLGQTEEGAAMVHTHSGAMAGPYRIFHSVMERSNVIEPSDLDQMWEIAALFQSWGTDIGKSSSGSAANLGVISLSGGDGAFIADQIGATSLRMDPPSKEFERTIADTSAMASGTNPFDPTAEVLANPELLDRSVAAFVAQNEYDYHLFASPVMGPVLQPIFCPALSKTAAANHSRRFAITMWTAGELTQGGMDILREADVPLFENSKRAVEAIDRYNMWIRFSGTPAPLIFPKGAGRKDPFYAELRDELAARGLALAPGQLIQNAAASGLAEDTAFDRPKVLKANCRTGVHKSAAGLVRLGILRQSDLAAAIAAMPGQPERDGFVLEDMVHADLELFVGGNTDSEFGKTLIVGLGGRFAETLGAPSLLVGDFDRLALASWLALTQPYKMLASLSDELPDTLLDTVEALGRWFLDSPDILSFDINPIRVDLQNRKLWLADCRMQ